MKTNSVPYRHKSHEANDSRFTVIVKPTHACNLKCVYCYVPPTAEHGRMSLSTARNLIHQAVDVGEGRDITFIWHGGEPLLLDLSFYRSINDICTEVRRSGHKLKNVVQTNGTLVNDLLLDFIVETGDFRLGLSLDGPAIINDGSRPSKSGGGSFVRAWATIQKIKEREAAENSAGIGGGVICVVGSFNVTRLGEIYEFFKEYGISAKFNPLFVAGRATPELAVEPLECADKMCRLFDMWFDDDDDSIRIDPFESIVSSLVSGEPRGCVAATACTNNFVSIGPLGDVYPCGRFDGTPEFRFGNVNESGGLKAALSSAVYKSLAARGLSPNHECVRCRYIGICNGGCMHNAFIEGDVMGRDPFCEFYKRLFGHALLKVKSVLNQGESRSLSVPEENAVERANVLGYTVRLESVPNKKVRRILVRELEEIAGCIIFSDRHTDHHDRYSKYGDHTDRYNDYSDHYQCGQYA